MNRRLLERICMIFFVQVMGISCFENLGRKNKSQRAVLFCSPPLSTDLAVIQLF